MDRAGRAVDRFGHRGRTHPKGDLMDDTRLRTALVEQLVDAGLLHSERWRGAFERVPRHVFVPRVFLDRDADGWFVPLDGDLPGHHDEWLRTVYCDDTLITQLDGDDRVWKTVMAEGRVTGLPTSSSSQPALMATMLEALDVKDGQRVLEIGTGTGYNAALMCEGLDAENVVSVDIDAALVEAAKERLAGLDYRPTVAAVDGGEGFADGAPYDRIMATCSLPGVPRAWIAQVRRGGRILVNLHRPLGGGALVLLTATDGAHGSGRFLPDHGGFMPTRTYATPAALDLYAGADQAEGTTRPTSVTIEALDGPFEMFAALRVPAQRLGIVPENGSEQGWLLGADGSWAYQTVTSDGVSVVRQSGPVDLWALLENAHAEWVTLGRPLREAFGLTVGPEGHALWLESPDSGHVWDLGDGRPA
jgi:methyltransferase of ATP-grasp peptide maturase system